VQIVAPLVPKLPADHRYRVVLMQRDLGEVLASQRVMLERNGRETSTLPPERLRRAFERQLQQVESWLANRPNAATLFVRYRDTVEDPGATAEAVARFLGGGLDAAAMARVVDPTLHRRRKVRGAAAVA
jgi:hypothetical protein